MRPSEVLERRRWLLPRARPPGCAPPVGAHAAPDGDAEPCVARWDRAADGDASAACRSCAALGSACALVSAQNGADLPRCCAFLHSVWFACNAPAPLLAQFGACFDGGRASARWVVIRHGSRQRTPGGKAAPGSSPFYIRILTSGDQEVSAPKLQRTTALETKLYKQQRQRRAVLVSVYLAKHSPAGPPEQRPHSFPSAARQGTQNSENLFCTAQPSRAHRMET